MNSNLSSRLTWLPLLLLILLVAACGKPQPVGEVAARPVKLLTLSASDQGAPLEFPAVIRARNSVEMAFNIPGKITELSVIEGQPVKEGSLLAALDNTEHTTRLKAAEAAFSLAQTDFDRFSELSISGAVAIAELDQKRAALQAAMSDMDLARSTYEDTFLRAPFDGMVARRLVQRFANVQAKQPVLAYQSLRPLDVVIDVPEPMVIRSTRDKEDSPSAMVKFDGLPGVELPVTFREVSMEADPQTQTFQVVFSLEDTAGFTVLPGMSAILVAQRAALEGSEIYLLPPLAVTANPEGRQGVWVYEPGTGTVALREVKVGKIRNNGIEILAGLSAGDQVVVAGTSQLSPGLKVRPLEQ